MILKKHTNMISYVKSVVLHEFWLIPSRMISHTDEIPSELNEKSHPPLLMFEPRSVKKVMDIIAKM